LINQITISFKVKHGGFKNKLNFLIFSRILFLPENYADIALIYKSSTFFRAQGVLRKNFNDEFIVGLLVKQLILIMEPNCSHPK